MKKVLIIEDDENIIGLLNIHLTDLDCEVHVATDGRDGYEMAINGSYDLMILDLMLPHMDGISICKKLRAQDDFTPILMLTAKSEEFDKVNGLESGADDYLTKPFGVSEFIARVKAILRRQERHQKQSADSSKRLLQFNTLEIDTEKRKVQLDGQRVELTPKEFDLLMLMANHPGRSYSRSQLLKQVWGYEFNGYEHTVNSHINRLRAKIEPQLAEPTYILTTWGIGYRFNDEL